MTNINIIK